MLLGAILGPLLRKEMLEEGSCVLGFPTELLERHKERGKLGILIGFKVWPVEADGLEQDLFLKGLVDLPSFVLLLRTSAETVADGCKDGGHVVLPPASHRHSRCSSLHVRQWGRLLRGRW